MVEVNDFFQEHSAQQLPNLSRISASLEHTQQDFSPAYMKPTTCMCIENIPTCGLKADAHSKLNLLEVNGSMGSSSLPPVYLQNLLPTSNLIIKGKNSCAPCGLGGKPESTISPGSVGKKYLIFDQCGNDMRMFFRSVRRPFVYPSTAAMNVYGRELDKELQTTKIDRFDSIKPTLHVEYDENHVSGNGTEMHEDTAEIDALLYSDESDYDGDYEEDDEVMSTGHSPNVHKRTYEKLELFENNAEELDSCYGPKKMQKVSHGQDMKLLLAENGNAINLRGLHNYHSDAVSNVQEEDMNSSAGNEPSRKTKIAETLRMLECIVPDAKGKDPMWIIDEAIDYLKSLKHRAMTTLGVHYH